MQREFQRVAIVNRGIVFLHSLNENLEVAALEGTFASVIGGAPVTAVVFAGEVEARTRKTRGYSR